ncbi:hypothetical protein CVT25_006107 [Psilocybe cyanescens]|uniref:Uncharacterized protein n=1 Tax=Psilocybe cyanescens TaxID=93625 RepID=A0A409XIK3_PSICY|nr:hypothetical protein CVT25_006107 [Psilocybe cyanescens]
MDLSPTRLSQDSLSPVLSAFNHQSNADLARLLAHSYSEVDDLRKELAIVRKRAEKADRLAKAFTAHSSSSTSSPPHSTTNGDQPPLTAQHAQQIKQIVDEYEQKLARAEAERDEAEARKREALEGWKQLDDILSTLELHTREARFISRSYVPGDSQGGGNGHFMLPPTSVATAQHQGMAPPNSASRQHSRHMSSRATVAFPLALPPHPNPNPTPTQSARRPRTPSMDSMYNASQPPPKRSRAGLDDQRGRPPPTSYSESYVASVQQQEYDQIRVRQQQQAVLQRRAGGASAPEARIIDRKYGQPHGASHNRAASPGHSRSGSHSSSGSMDVDEMLIEATTGDTGNGTPNGAGRGYLDSPHHHPQQHQQSHQHHLNQQLVASEVRRRSERDASPRAYPSSNISNSNNIAVTSANPYPPQHPSSTSYPANQSAPVSLRSSGTLQASPQNQSQASHVNHVFAPVVTGAPTKKTKFPNTPVGSITGPGLSGSGPSLDAPSAPVQPPAAATPYPPTNSDGQRICRQCGIVGRYKDGKCVEKWGPGPMGPGTVCDRCRKKMKRVERRGTLEQQQQQQVAVLQAQQQQHQPRTNSHAQLPSSQGSERSLNRSDTILTHQASHGPQTFAVSRNERDRDESTHTSSHLRSTHASNTTASFSKSQRHAPTPPSIASLREQHDDDDDDHADQERDPEQLPTSNIGRGGSAAAAAAAVNSRSDSRNGRIRAGAKATPPRTESTYPSGVTPAKRSGLHGSISPRGADVDEMDADADADAEAEAEILGAVDATGEDDDLDGEGDGDGEGDPENDGDPDAELLEAVDAAEANSNASSNGGDRSWLKSEPS